MKKEDVSFVMAQQMYMAKKELSKIKVSEVPFIRFKAAMIVIVSLLLKSKEERHCVDEFSKRYSKDPWSFVNKNATLFDFARLLSSRSGRTNAKIRAVCAKPLLSEEKPEPLKFIADQMECLPEEMDLNAKVRNLRLPFAGRDKHSWLTLLTWFDAIYSSNFAENPDSVADLTLKEFLADAA